MEDHDLLTSEERKALLPAWAMHQVKSHSPAPPDDRGLTCDERGCLICNGGDEAIETIVERALDGSSHYPDDVELIEAAVELASHLEDSLDYVGCDNCGARHGRHERGCLPCSGGPTGECDWRYWLGDWGCSPDHAAYAHAEHLAEQSGARI